MQEEKNETNQACTTFRLLKSIQYRIDSTAFCFIKIGTCVLHLYPNISKVTQWIWLQIKSLNNGWLKMI